MRASSASSWQRRKIFRHCTGFRPCSTSPFSTFPSPCLLPHPVHYVILYLTRFPLPLPLPSPSLHSLSPFLPSVLYFFILSLSRFPFPFNFPPSTPSLSLSLSPFSLPRFIISFFRSFICYSSPFIPFSLLLSYIVASICLPIWLSIPLQLIHSFVSITSPLPLFL